MFASLRFISTVWPRRILWAFLSLFVMMSVGQAYAAKDEIYTAWNSDLAVKGYDSVAYHAAGEPIKGKKAFQTQWKGKSWRFVSAANLELFKASPEKYAPKYGGYCAWAVSKGYTAKGDPKAWKIVEGQLYLNFNKSIQKKWEKDIPGHIKRGDENWPEVLK